MKFGILLRLVGLKKFLLNFSRSINIQSGGVGERGLIK